MSRVNASVEGTGDENRERPSPPPELGNTDHPTLALLYRRWERLNVKDEHWMCCIVGEEGSGKSYTALKVAKMIDPSFDETQVIFKPANLLERLENGEYERGDVFLIDEAGVGLGNRTWYDEEQVKMNQALQLIRDHNIGVLFTLPKLGELDSQTKGRLQDVIEMMDKEDGEWVSCNWWELDVDRLDMSSGRDGTWMQKPHWQGHEIQQVRFTPPEYDFIQRYEAQKDEFQDEVYAEARGEGGDEEDDAETDVLAIIDEIVNSGVHDLLTWHGGHNKPILSNEKIRMHYDLSTRDAKLVKDEVAEHPSVDIEAAWDEREADG